MTPPGQATVLADRLVIRPEDVSLMGDALKRIEVTAQDIPSMTLTDESVSIVTVPALSVWALALLGTLVTGIAVARVRGS